jgi:hypothetical protein
LRIDWFRTVSDLQRAGVPLRIQATISDVGISAVAAWKNGSEPRYSAGYQLIELYHKTLDRHPPLLESTHRTT